ncbi:MAG: TlpA family protein disulfide reductase [Ignavibacteria bacterium]|nr:TlpA family protein disulfide reductase [Ignavibacteria bacterium]
MKYLKILLVLIFAISLTSCGDKKEGTPNTETQNNTTQKVEQPPEIKLYDAVTSVDNNNSKGFVPNFSWANNDKKFELHENKGKVMLINFWATWCGPCKKEMPDLMEINQELTDKDFVMYGICVSDKEDNLKNYLKANPISYKILYGTPELVSAFENASGIKMEGIPTTFIVDKNLKIVETIVGSRSKDDFMSLIKKNL